MQKPIAVDLDGTLVYSDMFYESAIRLLKANPVYILFLPFIFLRGRAFLKRFIASRTSFDPKLLPFNLDFLGWLQHRHAAGHRLILCTGSDKAIAEKISIELGIFDEVISSDGVLNISGEIKASELIQRFGHHGFDYAGNSFKDLPVWRSASCAVVVNGSSGLVRKVKRVAEVEQVFPRRQIGASTWFQALRIHQWLKNLLLVVPLFASHEFSSVEAWKSLALAFFSFGFCASSVYLTNDLVDLESDRQHPRKRNRPFACGLIPLWLGTVIAPCLFFLSFCVASVIGQEFFMWLAFYFALTSVYSLRLKRVILVDCFILSALYTIRVIAGAAAVGQELTFWLLAFSVFLFLSLAFLKRYAELEILLLGGSEKLHGRGYFSSDAPLVQTMGVMAGYSSVVVLALYLNSEAVFKLYSYPLVLLGALPVMLFWVNWMWLQAHRGRMHDDPLVFAVKDLPSLAAGAVFVLILSIGAVGPLW